MSDHSIEPESIPVAQAALSLTIDEYVTANAALMKRVGELRVRIIQLEQEAEALLVETEGACPEA